jgi:hypothetical protein
VSRPARRLLATVAATVTLGTSLLLATASSASAASADYDFLSKVNASRSQHGLPALTMMSDLHSLATSWSAHMASGGCGGGADICHNPNLTSDVDNWQAVGENVGVGPDVNAIEDAFMNSPEHRANILDPDYTEVGIGTAVGKDGRLYVTQDFRKPMHTTAPSTPRHHASAPSAPAPTASVTSAASAATAPVVSSPVAAAPKPRVAAHLRHAAHVAQHSGTAGDPVSQALLFSAAMASLHS